MTQSLIIDPNEVRRPGYVKFPEVPVNQYTFDRETEIAATATRAWSRCSTT